jgi:hypothetical protein
MSPRLSTACPKPRNPKLEKPKYSSLKPRTKPIAKVGKAKAKREARNKAYYASPEWRAKKKATHERDGYQCVEMLSDGRVTQLTCVRSPYGCWYSSFSFPDVRVRCPNRGEIVNGKQTARGLVCEEESYGHRGREGDISRCKTRCKDCDRRRTPLERANHAQGFRVSRSGSVG